MMRSQRELAQLQYFDPEQFDVQINPDPIRNSVDITYEVFEKSTGPGFYFKTRPHGAKIMNLSCRRVCRCEK